MAGSTIEICNMALSHLGSEGLVTSIFPSDGTYEADMCERFYHIARRSMLSAYEWPFATVRVAGAELAVNPSKNWAHAYAVPVSAVKVWRVLRAGGHADADSADFQREGDAILTDEGDATLVYTLDEERIGVFSPLFDSAFSFILASYLAGPIIRGSEGTRAGEQLRQRAMAELSNASVIEANARGHKHEWMHEWVPEGILARQ